MHGTINPAKPKRERERELTDSRIDTPFNKGGWGDFTFSSFFKSAAIIFCAGFLFFISAGHANAATYYVKWDAAGTADGTSWTNAYTTIQAAITARTTSGSVIEISGGTSGHTYTETLLTKAGNITVQGSTAAGHSGHVTVSGSGGSAEVFKQQYPGGYTISNLTLTDAPNSKYTLLTQYATILNDVIISKGSAVTPSTGAGITANGPVTFNRVTIQDFDTSAGLSINAGAAMVFTANYSKFIGNGSTSWTYPIQAYAGLSVTFNDCLFEGNSRTALGSISTMSNVYVNNSIFDGNGYPTSADTTILNTGSGAVTVTNSLLTANTSVSPMGNDILGANVTDGGGNIYLLPQFVSQRRPAIFVIGLDDSGNFTYWTQLADLAETYGWRITLAAYTTLNSALVNWPIAKTYTDKGHEISNHTRDHQSLNGTQFLNIHYTGAGATATLTVDVQGNHFRTYVGGVLDVDLDISNSLYNDSTKIINYLNAHGNYTASIGSGASTVASPQILADVSGVDIKTANYVALIDQTRMFAYEINGGIADIQAGIPGYTVKTLVLPGGAGAGDATIMNAVQAAGLLSIRNVSGSDNVALENFIPYNTTGFQADSVLGTTADGIKKNVSGMIADAGYRGEIIYLFDHGADAFSLVNWTTVFDTLRNSNAQVMTYSAAMEYVRANGVDADGNQQRWTRTFTDQSNYNLQSTSPAIDSGIDLGLTTDYASNPIYGLPDIGGYEYQPPYTVGTNEIDIGAGARIYGDGKFRDVGTTGASTADIKITPSGGSFSETASPIPAWLDVFVSTWSNTGNHHKQWTESNAEAGLNNTAHTIGDLEANKYYNLTADSGITNLSGCSTIGSHYVCQANGSGQITFTYTGGYSTHTFDVTEGDNTAPTTTASVDSGTYGSVQSVTLTCADNEGGSGCGTTYYSIDGTNPPTAEYSTAISIPANATTTLRFYSTDSNGNAESLKTKTYNIDTTAPTVTAFTVPETNNSLTAPINSFTAADSNTGVAAYLITQSASTPAVDDAGWAGAAQTTYVFVTEGIKNLYAWAKDAVDNISSSLTGTITIDITPPIISFTDNVATGPTQSDTITADWGDSLIKKWDYDADGVCSNTAGDYSKTNLNSLTQNTETNNTQYICLYGEDAIGNKSTLASTNDINIDLAPPVITITNSNTDPAQSKTITASATESAAKAYAINNSGVNTCDGTLSFTAYTSLTFTAEADNGKKVCYKAQDTAGNIAYSLSNAIAGIDRTNPAVSAGTDKTVNAQVSQNAAVSDASGIVSYLWTKQSGPGSVAFGTSAAEDTTISADTDGTYVIRLTIIDNAGNSAYDEMTLARDTIAPALSDFSPDDQTFSVTTTSATLTLNTTETSTCKYAATSGVSYGSMTSFDSTDDTTHSTFISGLTSGATYTYYFKCQDPIVNTSDEDSLSFTIAPEENHISLSSIKVKLSRAINDFKDTFHLKKKKFKLKGEDTQLANGTVKLYIGGKLEDTITADADGAWDFALKLKDDAKKKLKLKFFDSYGTLIDTAKATVQIDTEKPVFTLFPPEGKVLYTKYIREENRRVIFKADDNQRIQKYKVEFDGRIQTNKISKNQTDEIQSYFISKDTSSGNYLLRVTAYDQAGNAALKETNIIVK